MEYSAPHPAEAEAYGEKYTVPSGTENTVSTINGLDDLLDKQIVLSGDNEKGGPPKTSVIAKVTDLLTPQEYAQFSMSMGMIGTAHHLHQKWTGARQDAHIVLEKAVGALSKEKAWLLSGEALPVFFRAHAILLPEKPVELRLICKSKAADNAAYGRFRFLQHLQRLLQAEPAAVFF